MILIPIVHIVIEIVVQRHSLQLAVLFRQGDNLMFRELHRTSLMHVDVSRTDTDDSLILIEHGVDGRGVGLRATRQEENLSVGHAAGFADAGFSSVTEFVKTIRRRLGIVVFYQVVKHLLTSSVVVVTFE